MEGLDLFHTNHWHPFSSFGITSALYALNRETIINTWIAMAIIITGAIVGRYLLVKNPESLGGRIVQTFIGSFMTTVTQSMDHFIARHCIFILTLFTFILICNTIILIPGLEEPTKDINTTLALSLISFFYVQKEIIRAHGLVSYAQEYFKTPIILLPNNTSSFIHKITRFTWALPINIISSIISFPLELQSKLASVLSMSFRLFGNIFGGALISAIWHNLIARSLLAQLIGLLFGVNLIITLFFGIFEGFIQAFVFSILTLTYLAIGVHHDEK